MTTIPLSKPSSLPELPEDLQYKKDYDQASKEIQEQENSKESIEEVEDISSQEVTDEDIESTKTMQEGTLEDIENDLKETIADPAEPIENGIPAEEVLVNHEQRLQAIESILLRIRRSIE